MNTIGHPLGKEKTISIDELRRNFGSIKKQLLYVSFILTERGTPIGKLTATNEMKKSLRQSTAGAFKGTKLDNDALWNDVLKKHSRKKFVNL